jgi:4-hydroxybenzoate polyprenyltransferase
MRLLRVEQWVKNLLVLLPLGAAHQFLIPGEILPFKLLDGLIVFVIFCLLSSSVYIINDWRDYESDRLDLQRKKRPIANQEILPIKALMIALFLIGLGCYLSYLLFSNYFLLLIFCYLALTSLYTFYLRSIIYLDCILLSSFYLLRVVAGAVALKIEISSWLLAFSSTFFFALAAIKRFNELKDLPKNRPYQKSSHTPLLILSLLGSLAAATVLFLYPIFSTQAQILYRENLMLFIPPIVVLYWFLRLLFLAKNQKLRGDPLSFSTKDIRSYQIFFITVFSYLASSTY